MNKIKQISAIIAVASLSFSYGLLCEKYQLFPYKLFKYIKNSITQTPGHSNYYYHLVSIHDLEPHESDVVMIGDSLTDYFDWNEAITSLSIANRGISGDTTQGVLERMDSILSTRADKGFIMIGINDLFQGKDVNLVYRNYISIIQMLINSDIKPYVQSTLLTGRHKQSVNDAIMELNDKMTQYCAQNSIIFINLNDSLSHRNLLNREFSRDSVHLNGNGYQVWIESISPYLYE